MWINILSNRISPPFGRQRVKIVSILCLLIAGNSTLALAADAREAAVFFSDGTVLTGRIQLTPGRTFKLNVPEGGKTKTTDMVTGEDVTYGKVRTFTFDPISEIRFYPTREEMYRKWRFIEKTKYDEKTAQADYSPAAKEYIGKPYPLRFLGANVIFSSGESLQGQLYTTVAYLKTESKMHKLVLRSKDRGTEDQTLDDLVYVSRIKMLDKGKDIAAKVTVKFTSISLGPKDTAQAITRDSLTPVPTTRTPDGKGCIVESTFGEDFYLAVKQGDKYLVGWPKEQDKKLWALAEDHVKRQRDFYNDKTLLGVYKLPDKNEVLTLVNLRRKVAPTNFGKIGGEWDSKLGTVVEPWRLSIWRWKYDPKHGELILSARGTFFRIIFLPKDPTPTALVSDELWNMRREKDTVIVGRTSQADANAETAR